jgi:hypothetical protein
MLGDYQVATQFSSSTQFHIVGYFEHAKLHGAITQEATLRIFTFLKTADLTSCVDGLQTFRIQNTYIFIS